MKEISLKRFIAHFGEDLRKEKRFCFILGAGASKTSGIPTGWEMVQQWVKEMKEADENDLNEWIKAHQINESDLASHYSQIFDKKFELSKKDGFAFLEKQMENAEPSCGYSVLAQILAEGKHNVVITTNFDSLTEDALFIYTQKKPLVVGHASLAEYISTHLSRPLVVKVHHDLFLSPKNSVEEVGTMDHNYSKNLKDIFKYYTPLVIGYGGNDGSLMHFLEELDHVEEGMFWFYREGSTPKENIQKLVEKVKGHFVPIKGFDELMIQLGDKLGLEPLDTKIKEVADKRIESYRKQIENITGPKAVDKETKEAIDNITSRGDKSWWNYELQARKEKDVEKKNEIYLKGIKEFSKSPELLSTYAIFLSDIKKDYTAAEKYYLKALEIDPNLAYTNGNYAIFLKDIKKDYIEAEKYYLKALEIDPNNANNNGNYAIFLSDIKKDYTAAEKHYLKALEIDPNHANNNGNYAIFLSDIKKDYTAAEKHYLKALETDPNHVNNNSNYSKYLIITGNKEEALSFINNAFKLNTNKENDIAIELWFYCYAIFPELFPNSKQKIEALLDKGVQSINWDFSEILKIAKADNHQDYEQLVEFDKRITQL